MAKYDAIGNAPRREWQPPYNSRIETGETFVLDKEHVKHLISTVDQDLADLAMELRHTVGAALTTGLVSWQDVGDALGVARQSAYERFRGAKDEVLAGQVRDDTVKAIGGKRMRIMYELRDGRNHPVMRRRNPALLLKRAASMPSPAVVKVYPDGVERNVPLRDVEEWAAQQEKENGKRKAAAAAEDTDEYDPF